MSDFAAEMRRAAELRGDTYSSMEIWGLLGRGAAEVERLRAALTEIEEYAGADDLDSLDSMIAIARRALEGK
jgi:hypothetical protein